MENLHQLVPMVLLGVIAYLLKDLHAEFKALSKHMQEIGKKIATIETKHDTLIAEQGRQIQDHETRIRQLEK